MNTSNQISLSSSDINILISALISIWTSISVSVVACDIRGPVYLERIEAGVMAGMRE